MVPTDREVGFSYVSCAGDERRLEECSVGDLTSPKCSEVGITQCFNGILPLVTCTIINAYTVSQVLVSNSVVYKMFEHVLVSENNTVTFCVIVWGPLTEGVHVLVETTDSGIAQGESMTKCLHGFYNMFAYCILASAFFNPYLQ